MLPKAILLDLDDTIVSYDGASDIAWLEMCDTFMVREKVSFSREILIEKLYEIRRWYWGDVERNRIGRQDMLQARWGIIKKALNELQYFDEAQIYQMAENYNQRQEELICLFPDSLPALGKIKSSGIRMALVTNGNQEKQRKKIKQFGLSDYIEFSLIEGELGFGKPDLRIFELALAKLELKAEEVWMVGDNLLFDVDAPQKIGIYSIWNDYRKTGLPPDSTVLPDRIINSISELID